MFPDFFLFDFSLHQSGHLEVPWLTKLSSSFRSGLVGPFGNRSFSLHFYRRCTFWGEECRLKVQATAARSGGKSVTLRQVSSSLVFVMAHEHFGCVGGALKEPPGIPRNISKGISIDPEFVLIRNGVPASIWERTLYQKA